MSKKLYFCKYEYAGQCVWGGHFLACDPAEARLEAGKAFQRDKATSKANNLPLGPLANECTLTITRSHASVANAMNVKG